MGKEVKLKNLYKYIVFFFFLIIFLMLPLMFFYKDKVEGTAGQPRSVLTVKAYDKVDGKVPDALELEDEYIYRQEIVMVSKEISGISLGIDNEDGKAEGNLHIILYKKADESVIKEWFFDVSDFTGKGFCAFGLEHAIAVRPGDVYEIEIRKQGSGRYPIKLQQAYQDKMNGKLYIDNKKADGLVLSYQINNGTCNALKYFYILISLVLVGGICFVAILLSKGIDIEKAAFISILFIGILYLLIIPPYVVPDEGTHFVTAYAQSSVLMGKEAIDTKGRVIGDSNAISYLVRNENADGDVYTQYIRGIFGKYEIVPYEEVTLRSPIEMKQLGYSPQVVGLIIGRLINANAIQLFVLGRLFALIFYAVVMYWAMRIIPFGKMALFVIGILPMTIQQAVSYSYDSVMNGILFLMIAYLFYLAFQKEKIERKDMFAIIAMCIIIIPIKFIYFGIVGLAILIPKEKFGGFKNKLKAAGVVILGSGILILFTQLDILKRSVNTVARNSIVDTSLTYYTFSYCINHPLDFIKIVSKTLSNLLSFYVESMIGKSLGWLDIQISTIIIICFVMLLSLCTLQKQGHINIMVKQKIVIGCVIMGVSALVFIVFLISETYVGSDYILGIQGRYFLPILPLALLLAENKVIVLEKNIDKQLLFAGICLQMITVKEIVAQIICR